MASWAAQAGIALDHGAEVPLGVQLDWSLRAAVAAGRLRPGERLPALRDLAVELGVNHNTLRAAVAKLETAGLLERRHGSGTFVAAGAAARDRHGALVEDVVRSAADAGVSPRELAAALYVRGGVPAAADEEAAERRALRDEIEVLERLLARIEPPGARPPAPGRTRRPGPRVLTAGDLRAQRDELLARLTASRTQDAEPAEEANAAPEPSRPARRRPAVPRAQPT